MNQVIKKILLILGITMCVLLILVFAISVIVVSSDIPNLNYPSTVVMPIVFYASVIIMLFKVLNGLINLFKGTTAKIHFVKASHIFIICVGLYFSVRPINHFIQAHNINYMPNADSSTKFLEVFAYLMIIVVAGAIIIAAIREIKKSPEQREEEIRIIRERNANNQRRIQERRYESGEIIIEVKLLSGGSTEYKRGGLGGAIVGGMLGGPLGAAIGATMPSGKGEQKQKFVVKYSDGKVVIKELHPNSWEYKELMKYVKWEDIEE